MESAGRQSPVHDSSSGGRQEIGSKTEVGRTGPGLHKIRPKDATRTFETNDLETAKARQTFNNEVIVSIPTGYVATDFEIPHNIGTIPRDIIFGTRSADTSIWRGTKDWTRKAIYLRSTVAVTVTLYLVP